MLIFSLFYSDSFQNVKTHFNMVIDILICDKITGTSSEISFCFTREPTIYICYIFQRHNYYII